MTKRSKPNLPAKSTSRGIQKAHIRVVPTSHGKVQIIINSQNNQDRQQYQKKEPPKEQQKSNMDIIKPKTDVLLRPKLEPKERQEEKPRLEKMSFVPEVHIYHILTAVENMEGEEDKADFFNVRILPNIFREEDGKWKYQIIEIFSGGQYDNWEPAEPEQFESLDDLIEGMKNYRDYWFHTAKLAQNNIIYDGRRYEWKVEVVDGKIRWLYKILGHWDEGENYEDKW